MNDNGSLIISFAWLAVIVIAYMFPMMVAARRNCKAKAAIIIVDLFLGWTFVGWVVALAWAAIGEPAAQTLHLANDGDEFAGAPYSIFPDLRS